ncbi:MAG TPA: hypothetical protein PLH75_14155 [Amaricoccus sp.]|nr:hypothetical protein [Paracoccaceae bacterium]MCC0067233.1 hypothetical protein [Rhodovulum sp.]HPG23927.1 hypothetical protein [Amaricoccus sp.]
MRPSLAVLAAALALPLPLLAGPLTDRAGAAQDIPVEEWIAMARGRTLTYRIDDRFWAMERYDPGSNRVRLQLTDGTCMEGTWDYSPPHYCFHWNGIGTACFRHVRQGDEILIIETRDGVDTPMVQTMTGVSDIPLACGPAVTS